MVTIRSYAANDLDAVISVFDGAVRKVASRDYNQAQINAWAQVDKQRWDLARGSKPTWVAESDMEIVGFSDLESDGHLDMMYVTRLFKTVELQQRSSPLLMQSFEGALIK